MPIAIVGIGCRFAGAPDLHAYWQLTVDGRNAFGPIPEDRWDTTVFFDENRRLADKSYAPTGGFIDDVRSFPALAFGIPPRRVEVMDPQQRFSLEVAHQAIEDAGYRPDELPRRTGVYMGVTAMEYRTLMASRITAQYMASGHFGDKPADIAALAAAVQRVVPARPFTAPGGLANMIAAVVAQELDLHGPAYTTDAACASGLVAVHDAVLQLRSGAIDAAVAGGVYLCLTPENHVAFSRIGAISGSGVCRPFDARADGFVQGDGAGALLLKRLPDAQRDGDRIYAVIRGLAMNNDGRGDGPMAPIEAGQHDCVLDAWRDAQVDPDLLGYVETHGTGTDVGDQTEFRGLQSSLGVQIDVGPHGKVVLGSSKGNVGHTMSAAGIAGLIRAALAVHHRTLPPMAGFEGAKAELGLDESPFRIPTRAEPWRGEHRVAAVSSFGFGGTNAHVVLSESPHEAIGGDFECQLVQLSAADPAALRALCARTADALAAEPHASVAGVARAWQVRREQLARAAFVAHTMPELIAQLRAVGRGEEAKGATVGVAAAEPPKVAFLYPGQGAQRVGMLAAVRDRVPAVAASLAELEADLADLLPVPLTHLMWPDRRDTPVDDATAARELTFTANCQPVLVAAGLALTRALTLVGVRPHVVTGHSLGEFCAAVQGGVLTAREAVRFAAHRGAAMAAVTGDPGAMAAIMADADTVAGLLVDGAVIANVNHPTQVVVSGTTAAVAQVVANATAKDVRAKALEVSHAFHSPIFAGVDLSGPIAALALHDPTLTVASGIADRPYASADDARAVFTRHASSPVDFVGALRQCKEAGAELFLQVGAGGPLASFARALVGRTQVFTLASPQDDDGGRSLLDCLGALWVAGVPVDAAALTAPAPVTSVTPTLLPREVYWAVKDTPQTALKLVAGAASARQTAASEAPAAPAAAVEAPSAGSGDDVLDTVIAVVAKVSSYPKDAVKPKQALIDDLGFDSILVADMARALAEAFPGLGGLPQELLINRPTVEDIADYVRGARHGGATAADDDAPLSGWAPAWRPTGPAHGGVRNRSVRVLGDGTSKAAIEAAIDHAGGQVVPGNADVVVWCADADVVPLGAVLAGERPPVDAAAAFLAFAAGLAKPPGHLLVVRRTDDPWAEALAGAARALAREWPTAIKAIALDPDVAPSDAARRLLAEVADTDVTVDVRLAREGRSVLGLDRLPAPEAVIQPGAVVAITGGTKGIGARLAARLLELGAHPVLIGRGEPAPEARALVERGATLVAADVLDRAGLAAALGPLRVTALVHAAGALADGPIEAVTAAAGQRARDVKIVGWLNAIAACGPTLAATLAVGSWAGRFGNRHQAHYAAANATLSALAAQAPRGLRMAVSEFGPWTSSEMAKTIPAAIQAAMRADGVDFVGDAAGLDALVADLFGGRGAIVRGRDLPWTTRARRATVALDAGAQRYLADHAIEGVPVLPLASATDLLAWIADLPTPFEVCDLTLFTGVTVREPTTLEVTLRGERAEIRAGDRKTLAYRARVRPLAHTVANPEPRVGGGAPPVSLAEFYGGITFHGPLLQGLTAIDGVGDDFARGRVRTGSPAAWGVTGRDHWAVDPLALDSAMQLSATIAWARYHRAGTPVGIHRYVQLRPWPVGELSAEVVFDPKTAGEGDKFVGTLALRDGAGALVALVEGAAAELRKAKGDDTFVPKAEWTDPNQWPAVQDLRTRLELAAAIGLRNPYFTVHDGTARNVTRIAGRELINYSSYNYLGYSGDPRVLAQVTEAIHLYGTSVSASRVASGERPFHGALERELAAAQGAEAALVFTAGHATNMAAIGTLMKPGDLVLHDELAHDSLLQGIRLSGAARRGFRHDDPKHLEQLLRELRPHHEKCMIVVEGVYSMDGDICALPAYLALKKKWGALLMVDEAHSFGVIGKTGRGVGEHYGIPGTEIDLWMGTLSKSLSSCGGWLSGSKVLIDFLRYSAGGFTYSAGLTPQNGAAALASLRLMVQEPERPRQLQANARVFHAALSKRGIDVGPAKGESAVIPVITGNSMHALMLSQRLIDQGVNVQPIIYPAVADNAARLRFFLSSTHTVAQLEYTAGLVADTLAKIRVESPV